MDKQLHLPGQHDQASHGNWARYVRGKFITSEGDRVSFAIQTGRQYTKDDYDEWDNQYEEIVQLTGKEPQRWRAMRAIFREAIGHPDVRVIRGSAGRIEGLMRLIRDPQTKAVQIRTVAVSPWNEKGFLEKAPNQAIESLKDWGASLVPSIASVLIMSTIGAWVQGKFGPSQRIEVHVHSDTPSSGDFSGYGFTEKPYDYDVPKSDYKVWEATPESVREPITRFDRLLEAGENPSLLERIRGIFGQ